MLTLYGIHFAERMAFLIGNTEPGFSTLEKTSAKSDFSRSAAIVKGVVCDSLPNSVRIRALHNAWIMKIKVAVVRFI